MSVASKEEEDLRKALVTMKSPLTGFVVVDKAKLAAVVKAEGLSFVDATANGLLTDCSGCDCSKPVVFLLNGSQLDKPNPSPSVVGHLIKARVSSDGSIHNRRGTVVQMYSSVWSVAKWIREDNDDMNCVVCYKTTRNNSLEDRATSCVCGTVVCFGCCIDLLMIADNEMTTECPNCRRELNANKNLNLLITLLFSTFDSKASAPRVPEIGEITEEHSDFIEKMTGVDLTLSLERVTTQVKHLFCAYFSIISKVIKPKSNNDYLWSQPESHARVYTAMREYIESKRKKKVVSASADDSRSSRLVARRGCANCGKQFWDKSEWKRALKCTKCQKAAYCSSKCRKKHAKAHTAECSSAKGAKLKRRPKKKRKKKKGCAPY